MGTSIKLMIKGRCQGANRAKIELNNNGTIEINGKMKIQINKATFQRLGGKFCEGSEGIFCFKAKTLKKLPVKSLFQKTACRQFQLQSSTPQNSQSYPVLLSPFSVLSLLNISVPLPSPTQLLEFAQLSNLNPNSL